MKEPRYKTIFASDIRVIKPSEVDIKEAQAGLNEVRASLKESKASIHALKNMLPYDCNPSNEPDLLYIAGNLAVGGTINKNDDGLTTEDAIATYKMFEKKLCDIEHNRTSIVGYIVRCLLTEIGTNRILDENEARKLGVFNISTVAILWRVANRELCNFIEEKCSNPDSPDKDALSLSFEVGFDDYKIVVLNGTNNTLISEAKRIISRSDESFDEYDQMLRDNGGMGVYKFNRIARILTVGVLPLGQGIVSQPAANVKGIVPILEVPAPESTLLYPVDADKSAHPAPLQGQGENTPTDDSGAPITMTGVGDKDTNNITPNPVIQPNIDIIPISANLLSEKDKNDLSEKIGNIVEILAKIEQRFSGMSKK